VARDECGIVVISHPEDKLSVLITAILRSQGIRVMHILPGALTSSQISLRSNLLSISGFQIGGVLFRASPETPFSDEFELNDQPFCDAEIRAVLLAALNLESVLAVNKYDAMTWFEGLGWPVWRRKLIHAGIPVSEFQFGESALQESGAWYPYGSQNARAAPGYYTKKALGSALTESVPVQHNFIIGKDIVVGERTVTMIDTAEFLANAGVYIAEVTTDIHDNILTVNTLPTISNDQIASLVSYRITEIFNAHLHSR
jgi:hypothetical protein